MSGPTLISRVLPKAAKKLLGKSSSKARLSIPRLMDGWADIIAPEDPTKILPVRVGWRWYGEGTEKQTFGTLHLVAPSALSQKLMFQERIIVERVNRLFGFSGKVMVTKISVSHDTPTAPPPKKRRMNKAVDSDTATLIEAIEDPVIRERLENLAKAMAASDV